MAASSVECALVACAIFYTFDQAGLGAGLQIEESVISEVLGRAEVEPAGPSAGIYRLRSDAWPSLLDELRRSRPRDEIKLHRSAFIYYLDQLREDGPRRQSALYQTACMHHLRNLRDLCLSYMR